MNWLLLFVFVALLLVGLALLVLARRGWERSGLPRGRVVYADTGAWSKPERALFCAQYRLTGKPDYLVRGEAGVVPVEVKSCRAPDQPYPSHVLQLAAYCLLVEDAYRQRPPYGIIRYADRTFEVDFTPELEEGLLTTLESMRADLADGEAPRNHDDSRRCRGCGQAVHCDQQLLDEGAL